MNKDVKPKDDTPKTEPKTVKMVNGNRSNGAIGAIANVATKNIKAWTDKGWSKAK